MIIQTKEFRMLEIRPNCEHCDKDLPHNSTEAMICSYECTYCKTCAINLFENVCPSCSGNFVQRPIRPQKEVEQNPPSNLRVFKPKDLAVAKLNTNHYKNISPEER